MARSGSADGSPTPPAGAGKNWTPPELPEPIDARYESADEPEWTEARLRSLSAELDRSSQRARRLYAVTSALASSLTPERVSEIVVTEGASAVGASGGMLVTAERGVLNVASAIACPPEIVAWVRGRPVRGNDPFARVHATGEPAWLGGHQVVPHVRAESEAWAILPLPARDRVIGVLALRFEECPAIPEEYRTFLILLAQQCAHALERARLYEAERTARVKAQFAESQLGFLATVSTRLAASLDETQSLRAVAEPVVVHMADICVIHLIDETDSPWLALAMTAHDGGAVALPWPTREDAVDSSDAWAVRVLRTGQSELVAVVDDAQLRNLTSDPDSLARLRELGLTSYLCVPIIARERVVGALTLAVTRSGRIFGRSDVALAEELAARLGQALDNAWLFARTREASRAKSNFLAVMSHELRTPLNAIMGYADLVLLDVESKLDAETKTRVERIRAAARHLLRQVEDVLSFARAESGRDTLRIEPVHLESVVADAIHLIAPLAAEKGLAVTFVADPLAVLHTDALRLGQILNNLLSNAVKFTLEGEVEVTATLDGEHALIHVRDTGIGIAVDDQDRIFEAFWQAEPATRRRFGGAGIGLGVARHLATLLGGRITVRSKPGEGSTFTLRIPARLEAAPSGAGAVPL